MSDNITFEELKKIIKEGTNEFKALLGNKVDSLNKKNNQEAYKEIEKQLKDYDGGLRDYDTKDKEIVSAEGDNKGMHNLHYDGGTATKDFKDRVQAQMKGYTSKQAEDLHKNDPYGNADFGGSLESAKEKQKEIDNNELRGKEMGLTGRETKDILKKAQTDSVLEGEEKMKQLYFKKTEFINEEHITSKIPEEYRVEKKRFVVKDKTNTEYLVEWSCNKANILQKMNYNTLNEELSRIKSLFNYKSPSFYSRNHSRIVNEDKEIQNMFNKVRDL